MSVITIPRDPGPRKSWAEPMPAWGRDSAGELFLRCACGLCMSLDHEVAPDGTVTPSLHHDDPKCGWHVMGRLIDWDGGKV